MSVWLVSETKEDTFKNVPWMSGNDAKERTDKNSKK